MSAAKKAKPNPFAPAVTSRAPAPAGAAGAKPRGATAKKSSPVRVTIDLDPADYARMRNAVLGVGVQADRPTLPHSAMWRALLAELVDDPKLAARVADRVREDQ